MSRHPTTRAHNGGLNSTESFPASWELGKASAPVHLVRIADVRSAWSVWPLRANICRSLHKMPRPVWCNIALSGGNDVSANFCLDTAEPETLRDTISRQSRDLLQQMMVPGFDLVSQRCALAVCDSGMPGRWCRLEPQRRRSGKNTQIARPGVPVLPNNSRGGQIVASILVPRPGRPQA